MSDNFDEFLQEESNRKDFFKYLKTIPSSEPTQNLLTLYLILRCFKTQNKTDPLKLKQIFDRTYKTCIHKHEHELEPILGCDNSRTLSDNLKNGVYDEAFLKQVTALIKKVLGKEYAKYELLHDHTLTPGRVSGSSVSSGLGSKSGSSLSLNQIPNPYHVKTKAVKPAKNSETQSLFETRRAKKCINSSLRKVKPRCQDKNTKLNINELTTQLEKLAAHSTNIDNQLDAHLDHVSRSKSTKAKNNYSVCHMSRESKSLTSDLKTTVAYYMPGESLAYLTSFNANEMILYQFKKLITKRGEFRYFFKTKTDLLEDDCVVFQEITDDKQTLPKFNDKIIAKVEYK